MGRWPIGWPALVLVALGFGWDVWQFRSGRFAGRPPVAFSFAAFWLVAVLLLMALWDLIVAWDDDPTSPSLGFDRPGDPILGFSARTFPHVPVFLRPWLAPAAFLVGLLLGHKFWL